VVNLLIFNVGGGLLFTIGDPTLVAKDFFGSYSGVFGLEVVPYWYGAVLISRMSVGLSGRAVNLVISVTLGHHLLQQQCPRWGLMYRAFLPVPPFMLGPMWPSVVYASSISMDCFPCWGSPLFCHEDDL
jgi:hypothetical protein